MKTLLTSIALVILSAAACSACIWDGRTLREERKRHPDLARAITALKPAAPDPSLRKEIERLRKQPQPDDPEWLNHLAGAYLRLNQPEEAVKILEPARQKFADNYGFHANLGTAYHLLARYAEAEREIALGLEINPEGHFGLERYHLALLQYLARDSDYQKRHVYIDEWTRPFLTRPAKIWRGTRLQPEESKPLTPKELLELKQLEQESLAADKPDLQVMSLLAEQDPRPGYCEKWNLAIDPKFKEGVLYMAELNQSEPAAWVMLGVAAASQGNYNLCAIAFETARSLVSPQDQILALKAAEAREYVKKSLDYRQQPIRILVSITAAAVVVLFIWARLRKRLFPMVSSAEKA